MDSVRQVINSDLLSGIISLPKDFHNKKVEVIVMLKKEKAAMPPLTKSEIDKMLKGSVTESLIGVLPRSDKSLDDYRSERLKKYERAD